MDASKEYKKVLDKVLEAAGAAEDFPSIPGQKKEPIITADKWNVSFHVQVESRTEDERAELMERGRQVMTVSDYKFCYGIEQDDGGLIEKYDNGGILAFINYTVVRQPEQRSYYQELTDKDLSALVQAGE